MINPRLLTKPEEMSEKFALAYNTKGVAKLLDLFESDTKVVSQAGEVLSKKEQIKTEFEKLLQLEGTITSMNKFVVVYNDYALLRGQWTIDTIDGKGESNEVVYHQAGGTSLYVINHPLGAMPI
ncbi:YybH family protein [Carnobacterium maltaromaticum]|uniref:YybH family protein n=1 Tax=Carnobacterium maltaromaticum TaxID=2751 RepID=UPI00295E5371|nr:DUF4440 domain-containing protein [Carnobacterium maltaromaticum]